MAILEEFRNAQRETGFSVVQLILLMELSGAKDVYTYPLPEDQEIRDEDYILAMQDLIQRGYVEYTDNDDISGMASTLRISESGKALFGDMFHAEMVLESVSLWEGTLPTLIYFGRGTLCTVTVWDSMSGYIGVSRIERSKISEQLEEGGFLPSRPFSSIRDGKSALLYDKEMQNTLSRLKKNLGYCSVEDPPTYWAMLENVRCVLRTVLMRGSPVVRDFFVFLETEREPWIVTRGQEQWEAVPDSLEYRKNVWRCFL